MTQASLSTVKAEDFSLVLGGPLFQLFRRARLSGNGLELMRRRIVFIALFAWLPLLVLALADGTAIGKVVAVPFLFDFDAQVRFLVALPLIFPASGQKWYVNLGGYHEFDAKNRPAGWNYWITLAIK